MHRGSRGTELRVEAGSAAPTKVVHIQCAQSADATRETRWLDDVARADGWPDALVAGVRIRERGAGRVIARNAESGRFRGVRDLSVQGEIAPADAVEVFDAALEHGASIELMVPCEHYPTLVALAARWPDVTIVLGHAGQPAVRTPDYLAEWSSALRRLAAATANVVLKVSALASSADPAWTVDSLRPWVLAAIEAFGAERCMLATNWPIDRLYGTYERLVGAYRAIVAGLGDDERRAVWHGTADRVYRL